MDILTAVVLSGGVLASWDGVRRLTVSNKRFAALEAQLAAKSDERDTVVANHGSRLATLELTLPAMKNMLETAKAAAASKWGGR